jgi:WD40 repeat protein
MVASADAQPALDCPYAGLQPYAEEHRDYFFGRDRERRIIAANLYASPLSVLYGASGVGKSSILQAGVAADMRRAPRTAIVYFNEWHDDSFLQRLKQRVHNAVAAAIERDVSGIDLTAPLDEVLAKLQAELRGNVLMLLDQFEEYFLYHPEEDTRNTFDAELARTVNRDDLQAGVLIALRDDWISRLDRFRARIPNLLGNTLRLAYLDASAAEEAIRRPLGIWNERHPQDNAGVEDALVEAIIRDVRTGRVSLIESAGVGESKSQHQRDEIETAFLQLVLTKLWEAERRERGALLRLATYDRLGGAGRIVQTHLNELLDRLPEQGRESCARMFPYMVTPTGSKIAHETDDLVAFTERPRQETVALLSALTAQRVLRRVTPPERYEIFHDVLAPAVLDWRAHYVQARQETQQRVEERLRAEARSAKKLRLLALVAVLCAVLAIALAWYANRERQRANDAAQRANDNADSATRAATLARANETKATEQSVMALNARGEAENQRQEAEKQRLAAKESENVALMRLVLTQALRIKDSDLTMGIQLARGALRASGNEPGSEPEDVLRQLVPPEPRDLPVPIHKGGAVIVAFSPDGNGLATADGREIKVWDMKARRARISLASEATILRFSPDGKLLAVGGLRGVSVLDCSKSSPTWLLQHVLTPPEPGRRVSVPFRSAVAFRAEGSQIAFAYTFLNSNVWTLRVWNIATQKPIVSKNDVPGRITHFAFSGDGNRLAGVSDQITVWNTADLTEVHSFDLKPDLGSRLALNDDGTRLAYAFRTDVSMLDVTTGTQTARIESPKPIDHLTFRPGGLLMVTTPDDEEIAWESASGKRVPGDSPGGVQTSPYGKQRAVKTSDASGSSRVVIESAEGPPFSVSNALGMSAATFQRDGGLLVTGDTNSAIRVWDVVSMDTVTEVAIDFVPDVVAMSGDRRRVAAAFGYKGIGFGIWETAQGGAVCQPGRETLRSPVLSLAFTADGARLAAGLVNGGAAIWDVEACRVTVPLKGQRAHGVEFSRDGSRLVTMGEPTAIWSADSGTLLKVLDDPGSHSGITWSPDEAAVATEDRLWDVIGKPKPIVHRLDEHGSAPVSAKRVAFSADNRLVATAGPAETVILWNRSGTRVTTLYGHEGRVFAIAFTANGREVLVITDKWKLYRHPVDVAEVVEDAKDRAPGPIDPKDCARALRLSTCPAFLIDSPRR